jgi:hypothetical protein
MDRCSRSAAQGWRHQVGKLGHDVVNKKHDGGCQDDGQSHPKCRGSGRPAGASNGTSVGRFFPGSLSA